MTSAERAEILAELAEVWRELPEMRFGQLIANLAVVARGTEQSAIWEMDDAELLNAIKWQLAELRSRRDARVA
jgi:hypothetical protein